MADARLGTAGFLEDLEKQREALKGRSPVYLRALALLPAIVGDGAVRRWLDAAWEHRRFFAWYDRPLLLLAALRHDAMLEGRGHPLWSAFAAPDPTPDGVTEEALRAGLGGSRDRVFDALVHRGVSTNETSRAVAWRWPALLAGAARGARPVALADVGASAGLNLAADLLPAVWTTEDGEPLEVAEGVHTVARLGLDPAPLDAMSDADVAWLRACVWPDERERQERLEAALAAFRAARTRPDAPTLIPIAAANVPARLDRLAAAEPGALVLAYQTILRDYLEPSERAEYEGGMREWLATHPAGSALWVELENAGAPGDALPASIVAHARTPWGELRDVALARCGYHPTRIVRDLDAVAELEHVIRAASGAEVTR